MCVVGVGVILPFVFVGEDCRRFIIFSFNGGDGMFVCFSGSGLVFGFFGLKMLVFIFIIFYFFCW